jgi:hypothetical protein
MEVAMVVINKAGQSAEELADKVYALFLSRGYKLEEGTKLRGVYGNGSAVGRALLGGFVKRNKFSVSIDQTMSGYTISLDKAMSGTMGGALGVSKINKELTAVQQMLTDMQ